MVHHRPALHTPLLQPYSKLHKGRPGPALQPLRPRGIHQRAVPQPRRHLVQRNVLHTVHHEPRLLPRRARTVQLLHGPHRTGQTGAAKAVVGRNDAKARHQRLRTGKHRIRGVLDDGPLRLHTSGRHVAETRRKTRHQPRRGVGGRTARRQEILRERHARDGRRGRQRHHNTMGQGARTEHHHLRLRHIGGSTRQTGRGLQRTQRRGGATVAAVPELPQLRQDQRHLRRSQRLHPQRPRRRRLPLFPRF